MEGILGKWIYCKDQMPEDVMPERCFTENGEMWFEGAHVWAACRSLVDNREPWVTDLFYSVLNGRPCWGYGVNAIPMVELGKAEVYDWMMKEFPEPPEIQ